jgi:cellulose biosynthesis protein BcsQ
MNAITADSIRKKSFYIGTRKGGVGKTSITVNCGHEAARYGAKVLVLDFDSQADSSVLLGADPDSDLTISDVYSLDGDTKFDDAVKSAADICSHEPTSASSTGAHWSPEDRFPSFQQTHRCQMNSPP